MKVSGKTSETNAHEYAREVADAVTARLERALSGLSGDVELPEPDRIAEGLVDGMDALVAWRPGNGNELADLLGPFWSGARVREALGIPTRQALDSRRRSGSVLGLKTGHGTRLYPLFQFQRHRGGRVEVKPALVPVLRTLRGFDAWAVGVLLHTTAPELDGLTPLEWTRRHRSPDAIANFARSVARNWSAGAASA